MVKLDIINDSNLQFIAKINNTSEYFIEKNNTQIVSPVDDWFLLQLRCESNNPFTLNDIFINGESIRHMIYTGWFTTDSDELLPPPITEFRQIDGFWNIVLHSDCSVVQENYYNQVNENNNWQNFLQRYAIYVDFGTELNNKHYPPSILKFYQTPQGINWHEKNKLSQLPHFPLNCITPDAEFFNKIKELELPLHNSSIEISDKITVSNNKIHGNWYRRKWLDGESIPTFIHDWLQQIGITQYKTVNVLRLGPKGYIRMHRDYHDGPHIHYTFGSGNGLLKLSRSGIMSKGLNYIGSSNFAHAAVNDSDSDRYAMTIELHDNCDDWLRQHIITGIYIN